MNDAEPGFRTGLGSASDSPSLFAREPETLDGYTPALGLEATKLHLRSEQVKNYKSWDQVDDEDTYTTRYYITLAGLEVQGTADWYSSHDDEFEIATRIANEFLAKKSNEKEFPVQYAFLQDNARILNNSKRYWKSWTHRQEIEKVRRKAFNLLRQVARAEVIASANAVEVKAERTFSSEERQILLAEFFGGEFKTDDD